LNVSKYLILLSYYNFNLINYLIHFLLVTIKKVNIFTHNKYFVKRGKTPIIFFGYDGNSCHLWMLTMSHVLMVCRDRKKKKVENFYFGKLILKMCWNLRVWLCLENMSFVRRMNRCLMLEKEEKKTRHLEINLVFLYHENMLCLSSFFFILFFSLWFFCLPAL